MPLSTQPTAREESIRTHRCQVQQQSQLVDEGAEEGEEEKGGVILRGSHLDPELEEEHIPGAFRELHTWVKLVA